MPIKASHRWASGHTTIARSENLESRSHMDDIFFMDYGYTSSAQGDYVREGGKRFCAARELARGKFLTKRVTTGWQGILLSHNFYARVGTCTRGLESIGHRRSKQPSPHRELAHERANGLRQPLAITDHSAFGGLDPPINALPP